MKRGIVVLGSTYASRHAQEDALGGLDEIRDISPMTSEDRYYQFADATSDLSEGDEVHIVDLSYLGSTLSQMCATVGRLTEAGVGLVVAGQDTRESGFVAAVSQLLAAERAAQIARVTELKATASSRRTATPPKCILVPAELVNCCTE